MSGKTHPIRKMQRACERAWSNTGSIADCRLKDEAIIIRHLQPLLDTISEILVQDGAGCACEQCKLLAAWKEPLR